MSTRLRYWILCTGVCLTALASATQATADTESSPWICVEVPNDDPICAET